MYYDRKARPKNFKVGELALLLLPTKSNKLLLQWRGPYQVVRKVSPVDYVIAVRGKEKTYHVNMLKLYNARTTPAQSNKKVVAGVMCITEDEVPDQGNAVVETCPIVAKESIDDIKLNDCVTETQKHELVSILQKHAKVLTDLPGCTDVVTHSIQLLTEEPVRVKSYTVPYSVRESIDKEVQEMLRLGVIVESNSPYSAPPVIVKKPDGSDRFCVNYKCLNQVTVFDPEPMPDAEEIFLKLRGKKYKSKIDLSRGYWQIKMDSKSMDYTAFSTPGGHFSFQRMPFGLVNSAATFNRLMRKLFGSLEGVECFIDDIIIFSEDWPGHVLLVDEVLGRLSDAGLTAKPSKCMFGYSDLVFLGHQVSVETISPREQKVNEILAVPRPVTKHQLRSFIAMANYYSKFIPHFADLAEPLTSLTQKHHPNRIQWSSTQENAFQKIKEYLSKKPIMKILNTNKMMYVQTDASNVGLAAALLQEYDGILHPVRYLSRKLKKPELNYSIIEKECLAVIWAIHKLKVYLYGTEFILLVDNKPLSYMKESAIKNARVARWLLCLQDCSFQVQSIKGIENHIADCLSRI
jgi:hypothetical protein